MDPSVQPSAKMVGDAFAEQYYAHLLKSPGHLLKFYNYDSKISRPGLDGTMRATTFRDIDEKDLNLLSSGGFDSAVVTSVMSQDSHNGSILIAVDGYFTSKQKPARNFKQSFVLARQETEYFVFNDMFKFIDISEANASISPADNGYRGQEQFDQNRHEHEQVRGTRFYNFWDMQKAKEEQSKLQEEKGKLSGVKRKRE